ncbi:MAG: class I tRNA ligase family protein, partial [Armatimonadetes bacterium]|nr:class I tRNA ligase family protein [Armatimonadota bacterium]
EQWYVKMEELARRAAAVIEAGEVRFVPERYARPTLEYLHNIRDWCISRQLWWGHRIPIYSCSNGHEFASVESTERCPECGDAKLEQDPDVLDTWFSSALWPFAVLNWPGDSDDLNAFYPTDLMITDRQIIRLWVCRMVFSSLHFLDKIPFPDVYIHATVLTRDGKRMSKSKGTGVDPMVLIERYGADATRFGLLQMAAKGQDIRFTEERIESARLFCNKLLNASRFVMMHLGNNRRCGISANTGDWTLEDQWIASRLHDTIQKVNDDLAEYNLDDAANAIYEFVWNEFCDWYLELAKPRLQQEGEDAAHVRGILMETLETSLRLLHPFMPFITEEIWQTLKVFGTNPEDWGPSIMEAPFPDPYSPRRDESAEAEFGAAMEIIGAVRRLRSEAGVQPGQRIQAALVPTEGNPLPDRLIVYLNALSKAEARAIGREEIPQPSISDVTAGVEIYLPLAGLVDVEKETAKLRNEIASVEKDLAKVRVKLANEQFTSKAPPDVVEKERNIQSELETRLEAAQSRLEGLLKAG